MDALALIALIFASVATLLHLVSTAISLVRLLKISPSNAANRPVEERVTIIRPVCGVDPFERTTLCSTFKLNYSDYDIIFCSASEQDPVVPLVRALMAEHPHVRAQLLIGDDRSTPNPKLNNLIKGWRAATAPWIVMADSNVLMPESYIDDLFQELGCPPPDLCAHPPSEAIRRASGPNWNVRFLTPIKRAGSSRLMPSASALPKANPCCGVGRISSRQGAFAHWRLKSPRTQRPQKS